MRCAQGRLKRGQRILDASSGNTGIAYAMIGANLGFEITLCLPKNANAERKQILAAYGVEVVETDPLEGSDGAIRKARELAADTTTYAYLDQYSNENNWKAHLRLDGPGDRSADRRGRDALRQRTRHKRDVHGNHPLSQAMEPVGAVLLCPAGLAVSRA